MVSIVYPTLPRSVDYNDIMRAATRGYEDGQNWKNERDWKNNIAPGFADSLYGQQQAPQTLSSLGSMFSQPEPSSTVQRAPMAAPMDPASARVEQAFAAQGQGRNQPLSSNQIAGRFLKTVRDGGVTNPYALAAIAATGKAESGFSPQNATGTWSDPSQSGQAGTAGGIMSWRGPRLQALLQFAQQNGDNPSAPSPETQAKFLLAEDPGLIQKLQAAKSPQEAQELMNNAWRFAGYNQPGGEAAERMASANQYAQQFGGTPSQQALESLAVGGSTPMPQALGVQVADASGQSGYQPPNPSSILPPRDVMLEMLRNPISRPLAVSLAQSAQKMRANQNDPTARLEYETAVEKLRQLRDPRSKLINSKEGIYDPNTGQWINPPNGTGNPETGLTPQMMRNPKTGETIYVQPTKDGRLLKSDVPEGFQPYDPYAKAYQTNLGKTQGENAASLPGDIQTSNQTVQQIDELLKNPGLNSIVGPADQYRPSWTLGDSGRDALARFDQLKGKAFLQAFGMLRGGGQITEVEGQKAQDAMARMDRAQGEKEFRQALTDFRDAVQQGIAKLREKAGQAPAGVPAPAQTGNRTSSGVQWSIEE